MSLAGARCNLWRVNVHAGALKRDCKGWWAARISQVVPHCRSKTSAAIPGHRHRLQVHTYIDAHSRRHAQRTGPPPTALAAPPSPPWRPSSLEWRCAQAADRTGSRNKATNCRRAASAAAAPTAPVLPQQPIASPTPAPVSLPHTQRELGKRLGQLARAVQQAAEAGAPDAAPSAAAAAADGARQADAALQQALAEAAERIRDFQRHAEHTAQQVQIDAALAPVRAEHEEERGRLLGQLAEAAADRNALCKRMAALEDEYAAAVAAGAAWQQRAATAEKQAAAAQQQHERAAAEASEALAAAEAQAQALVQALAQAQAAAASDASLLQREREGAAAEAARLAGELAAASKAWHEQQAALEAGHEHQRDAWAADLDAARQRGDTYAAAAASEAARALVAEQQVARLQGQVQQLSGDLATAREELQATEAALGQAREQGAGLGARLAAAEADAEAAKRQAAEQQHEQLAAAARRQEEEAERLTHLRELHRWVVRRDMLERCLHCTNKPAELPSPLCI